MQSEHDLVPFAPGRLDGSPVLVVAPHPDDEIFGCGGALVQAVRSGARVRVVILTDGEAQGDAEVRRAEAQEAARRLGLPMPEFWGLADRSLRADDAALAERLQALLIEEEPRIVLVPSPAEIHPDHRALALVVYRVLQGAQSGSGLHRAVDALRLATYEVSAVLRPNLVVDVTDDWEEVLAAAKAYSSQVDVLPYVEVLDGLASARRLTMPSSVRRAEAYHVVDMRFVRSHSAAEWAASQGPSADLEQVGDAAHLDVVVRTRNRPQLLRQALASIGAQLHPPATVVVVNDGGLPVDELCAPLASTVKVDLVQLESSRGRSAAAQLGLERCTASHVVFLDDDDLMLPEHLLVLGRAVARGATVPYVEAVQGMWRSDGTEGVVPVGRHRTFGGAFDPNLLYFANYIPLPTVALPRQLALDVGGFDASLDLYEDWDLLLRLAARTPFEHVPVITCEYRVIEGGSGITAANPPGSQGQLRSLQAIWKRHGLLADSDRLAAAAMALLRARDSAAEQARLLDERLLEVTGKTDGLQAELHRLRVEALELRQETETLTARLDGESRRRASREAECAQLENEQARLAGETEALHTNVANLTATIEALHASKTFKLRAALERLFRPLKR